VIKEFESGRDFVNAFLEQLADELNAPEVRELDFEVTDKDFDERRVSLVDRKRLRVVTKIDENDLADCMTTPSIRRKLEQQLRAAILSYSPTLDHNRQE